MVTVWTVTVEGRVTAPLPEVSPVCDGGQLQLNCTITGSMYTLQWRFIPDQNQSQLSTQSYFPTTNQTFQYGGSTVMFEIFSHSMEMTTYLIVISPVNSNLNGIEVECTDLEDQESSTTIIRVLNAQGIIIIWH